MPLSIHAGNIQNLIKLHIYPLKEKGLGGSPQPRHGCLEISWCKSEVYLIISKGKNHNYLWDFSFCYNL